MPSFITIIGLAAAFCTTLSYVPQVRKAWKTQSTGDLSLKMILILSAGISLWVVYGVMRTDTVIIAANSVSLLFLANLLFFKLKEIWGGGQAEAGQAEASGR